MTEPIFVNVYICGFNGFQQIEHAVKDSPKLGCACNIPQRCSCRSAEANNLPGFVFTWSNIWQLKGSDQVDVFGFKDGEIARLLSKGNIHTKTVVPQRHDVILINKQKDSHNIVLLEDDELLKDVFCDTADVEVTQATENEIYGLKDGQLYRGRIEELEDKPMLKLQCLDLGIKVSKVSCGFDHTLMLSSDGEVYSSGSSSRGQLGHGYMSVDIIHSPTLVTTLCGIRIVVIATGGWHSTAVAESGDLYVWGWNEAGQLGLPTENCDNKGDFTQTVPQADVPSLTQATNLVPQADVPSPTQITCLVPQADVPSPTQITSLVPQADVPSLTQTTSLVQQADVPSPTQITRLVPQVDVSSPTQTTSLESVKEYKNKDCISRANYTSESEDLDPGIPLRIIQDIDPVQIQTVPYGLEIPDDICVSTVACGSRHTCVLLDSGYLLTTGWNKYGQLGHGHINSTDYLQTVTFFPARHEKVVDVFAGFWNTGIITRSTRECGPGDDKTL